MANKLQSVHNYANTFSVYLILARKFWRIAHNMPNLPIFFPTKYFPCTIFTYTTNGCILQVAEVGRDAIGLRISPIQFR